MKQTDMPEKLPAGTILRRGILTKNPVLAQAVGLCPLVAVCISLKTAVSLAGISAMLLILMEVFSSVLYRRLPRWLRVGVYALTGMLLIVPMVFAFNRFGLHTGVNLGIFLPLLAVNSLIVSRCEGFAVKNGLWASLLDAVAYSVGYGVILLVVGLVRELLGSGTLWDTPIKGAVHIPALLLPFGGFLLLAFLAAGLNWLLGSRGGLERTDSGPDRISPADAAEGMRLLSSTTETLPKRGEQSDDGEEEARE